MIKMKTIVRKPLMIKIIKLRLRNLDNQTSGRFYYGLWGGLTANGAGYLVRLDGMINAEKNRQILIQHPIPTGKCLIDNGFIFPAG